jgi:hypothetical protein
MRKAFDALFWTPFLISINGIPRKNEDLSFFSPSHSSYDRRDIGNERPSEDRVEIAGDDRQNI